MAEAKRKVKIQPKKIVIPLIIVAGAILAAVLIIPNIKLPSEGQPQLGPINTNIQPPVLTDFTSTWDGKVRITWDSDPSILESHVFRANVFFSTREEATLIATVSAGTYEYTDQISTEGDYYYCVSVKKALGESPLSNCWGNHIVLEARVETPEATILSILPIGTSIDGKVYLSWTAVQGVFGYSILRSIAPITSYSDNNLYKSVSSGITTITDAVATNGIYNYAVFTLGYAFGGATPGKLSNVVTVTVNVPGHDSDMSVFTRIDENAGNSFFPYSYAVYQGAASSTAYSYGYATSPQTKGGELNQFVITEDELKTRLGGIPTLYTQGQPIIGQPIIFYGKRAFNYPTTTVIYHFIIKIGDYWYVAQYGVNSLIQLEYALRDIAAHVTGFYLPSSFTLV